MINLPWMWSHLSFALLVAAIIVAVVKHGSFARLTPGLGLMAMISLVAGGLLSVVPLGETDLAGYLLAYSGELSFAALFYLFLYVVTAALWPDASPSGRAWRRQWCGPQWVWAVAGCALYLSALSGRGPDVYAAGFRPPLAWAALAASGALAIAGRWLPAVLLLGIVGTWQVQLSGASNLWDYAIDPFIFLGSLWHSVPVAAAGWIALSRTKRGAERKLAVMPVETLSPATPETCTYQG